MSESRFPWKRLPPPPPPPLPPPRSGCRCAANEIADGPDDAGGVDLGGDSDIITTWREDELVEVELELDGELLLVVVDDGGVSTMAIETDFFKAGGTNGSPSSSKPSDSDS